MRRIRLSSRAPGRGTASITAARLLTACVRQSGRCRITDLRRSPHAVVDGLPARLPGHLLARGRGAGWPAHLGRRRTGEPSDAGLHLRQGEAPCAAGLCARAGADTAGAHRAEGLGVVSLRLMGRGPRPRRGSDLDGDRGVGARRRLCRTSTTRRSGRSATRLDVAAVRRPRRGAGAAHDLRGDSRCGVAVDVRVDARRPIPTTSCTAGSSWCGARTPRSPTSTFRRWCRRRGQRAPDSSSWIPGVPRWPSERIGTSRFDLAPTSRWRWASSHHLDAHDLIDRTFVDAHTSGADELVVAAREWPLERAADVCGVSADDIAAFAEELAAIRPAYFRMGWGIERNRNGGAAYRAVLALPLLTGQLGVLGAGIMSSLSRADTFSLNGAPAAGRRKVNMNELGRLLDAPSPGEEIRVLFVQGSNPAATCPNQKLVHAGLARDEVFTVVHDQVLTDTARFADVVLPATTHFEVEDLAGSYGTFVRQRLAAVIDRVGESRTQQRARRRPSRRVSGSRPNGSSRIPLRSWWKGWGVPRRRTRARPTSCVSPARRCSSATRSPASTTVARASHRRCCASGRCRRTGLSSPPIRSPSSRRRRTARSTRSWASSTRRRPPCASRPTMLRRGVWGTATSCGCGTTTPRSVWSPASTPTCDRALRRCRRACGVETSRAASRPTRSRPTR